MKMQLPSFARRKGAGQDESTLKALAAARSPADAEAAIHSFPPIRAVVAATHLATLLWPSNLHTIEQAAAADELANKAKAQDMLGYKLDSIGHAIKRDWLDSGRATEMGRVSAQTLAWLVHGSVFYEAAAKPFEYGLARGGWEGLAIAAAASLIGYATARGLKAALAGIDRACNDANSQKDGNLVLIASKAGQGAKIPLFNGPLMKAFGWSHKIGGGLLRWLGRALGFGDLKHALARWVSAHLSDSQAFAMSQALVARTTRHRGFGAWGAARAAVYRVAERTGMSTLAVSGIPNEYRNPLAYDGLLPTGETLGDLQPSMVTEHPLGLAARAGVVYGLLATLGTLVGWHPAMLDWSQLFEHSVQGLLEGLLTFAPATSLAMGGLFFAGAFRSKLAESYARARIEHNTESVEQMIDFQAHESARRENDRAMLRQLHIAKHDRGMRFVLGKNTGILNKKGMHDQPVRGTTFAISEDVAKTGIALQGGTGSGKSLTGIEPFQAQLLAYRSELLLARRSRALRRAIEQRMGRGNRYRTAAMETKALSIVVMDYKMAMSELLWRQAAQVGQRDAIRLIGADEDEYAVDLLEGLTAQQAMDLLSEVLATRGGSSGDGPWLPLAKNVARACASLARVFQFSDDGLIWITKHGIKPFSIRFIYDMAMDSEGRMIQMCFDAVERAMKKNDAKVTASIDDTFYADMATLMGDQWLSAPAAETKMGILINIQTLLGALVSDPLLGQTFGSGNGAGMKKKIMSLSDVWGDPEVGALVASNLSFDLYGEPAAILNAFLKLRLYLEAQNRQTKFRNIAAAAERALREIHTHLFVQELADESNPATAEYLRLQKVAEPVLREVVRRLQEEALWPLQPAMGADGRVDEAAIFGPGPFQSQFRRATRLIEQLGATLSSDERRALNAPEAFRRARSVGSASGGAIGQWKFSGTSVSFKQILARGQRPLEMLIEGVAEEEAMLENYIFHEGAPACPSEGLPAVRNALDRHAAYLLIDEFASLATVSSGGGTFIDDVRAAQTLRSTNLRLFFAYQTPAILINALGDERKFRALIASLRTQIILPDDEQETIDRIRYFAGSVEVRDTPKHGIRQGDRIIGDRPYAEKIAADGDSVMRNFEDWGYNKNPTMPYGGKRFDTFCDQILNNEATLNEIVETMPDDLAFDAAAIAGRVTMHGGFSFEVGLQDYADNARPKLVENNGSDNQNEIAAWEKSRLDDAANKNIERLATPVRKEEPISRNDVAQQNLAFVTVLQPGNRYTMDLVELNVSGNDVLQAAQAKFDAETLKLNLDEQAFKESQEKHGAAHEEALA